MLYISLRGPSVPSVLLQIAAALQLCSLVEHFSISKYAYHNLIFYDVNCIYLHNVTLIIQNATIHVFCNIASTILNIFASEFNLPYSMALPVQVLPSPEYPGLHVQLYDPLILLHSASALQLCVPVAHSSISKYAHYLFTC